METVLFVLVTLISVSLTSTVPFDGCTVRYDRRSCHHRMLNGVLVTCDGQGSEKVVPQNLPQDTVYLSLANFDLTHLKRKDFQKFTNVECLAIVDSGVQNIDSDTFTEMGALLELSLQNNRLSSKSLGFVNDDNFNPMLLTVSGSPDLHKLQFQATKNLNRLKTLNLNGNGIIEVERDIFSELTNLEHLDLSHNKLKSLDWDRLKNLPKLNQLYLDHNLLQTIPQSMYGLFFAVKNLRLAGNRFHCNCNLRWLAEFYTQAVDRDLDKNLVNCVSPVEVALTQLSLAEFVCSRPSQPIVSYTQTEDNRYEINCTSEGDPAPTLSFTLPSGRQLLAPPPPDLSKNKPVTPQILTDPGVVYCEASNSEGRSETIEGLPHILQQTSGSGRLHISLGLVSALTAVVNCRLS